METIHVPPYHVRSKSLFTQESSFEGQMKSNLNGGQIKAIYSHPKSQRRPTCMECAKIPIFDSSYPSWVVVDAVEADGCLPTPTTSERSSIRRGEASYQRPPSLVPSADGTRKSHV